MRQRGQAVAVTARAPRAPLLSLVVSLVLISPIKALVVWPQARTGLPPRACAAHPRCAVAGASTSSGDLYASLGIDATASAAEVKRAYRRAALRNHPDVNKAADAQEAFARIAEAYTVLSDPEQRAKYDRKRRASGGGWASGASSRPGATTGWDRGGGGRRGARPSAASAGRSDEWEARRRAEEARYDTGGDSFGALLGDLVSATAKAFGGGAGGWARTAPLPRSRRHRSLGAVVRPHHARSAGELAGGARADGARGACRAPLLDRHRRPLRRARLGPVCRRAARGAVRGAPGGARPHRSRGATLCATSPSPPHQNTDTNHQPPATKHHQTPPNTNPRDAAAFLARRAPLPSTPPPPLLRRSRSSPRSLLAARVREAPPSSGRTSASCGGRRRRAGTGLPPRARCSAARRSGAPSSPRACSSFDRRQPAAAVPAIAMARAVLPRAAAAAAAAGRTEALAGVPRIAEALQPGAGRRSERLHAAAPWRTSSTRSSAEWGGSDSATDAVARVS